MKITIGGEPLVVYFAYWTDPIPHRNVIGAVAGCFIRPAAVREDGILPLVAMGTAYCAPEDRFCKVIGRKIALQRALEASGFSREHRAQIWAAYRATHRYAPNRGPEVRPMP